VLKCYELMSERLKRIAQLAVIYDRMGIDEVHEWEVHLAKEFGIDLRALSKAQKLSCIVKEAHESASTLCLSCCDYSSTSYTV
jgi:hypothetical protein